MDVVTTAVTDGRPVDSTLFEVADGTPTLIGSICTHCGVVTFPEQRSCPACTTDQVERHRLARRGTLWSYTVQAFPPKPPYVPAEGGFRPYPVGYVELGGEVIVETRIIAAPEDLAIGIDMELVLEAFRHDGAGPVVTYAFRPTGRTSSEVEEGQDD